MQLCAQPQPRGVAGCMSCTAKLSFPYSRAAGWKCDHVAEERVILTATRTKARKRNYLACQKLRHPTTSVQPCTISGALDSRKLLCNQVSMMKDELSGQPGLPIQQVHTLFDSRHSVSGFSADLAQVQYTFILSLTIHL